MMARVLTAYYRIRSVNHSSSSSADRGTSANKPKESRTLLSHEEKHVLRVRLSIILRRMVKARKNHNDHPIIYVDPLVSTITDDADPIREVCGAHVEDKRHYGTATFMLGKRLENAGRGVSWTISAVSRHHVCTEKRTITAAQDEGERRKTVKEGGHI